MLFNSYEFLTAFLPIVLLGFWLLRGTSARLVWLTASSLFFYAWWNPPLVLLLVGSIGVNFTLGKLLAASRRPWKKPLLVLGVGANLATLGYFKYAGFLAGMVSGGTGLALRFDAVVLPLAISFFTFQQIAWLVDAYRRDRCDDSFRSYAFFVSFFPQLLAGPIVHHSEIMPQLRRLEPTARDWSVGLTLLILGLAKKVVLADAMIPSVSGLFTAAQGTTAITPGDAWLGTLAYTMQLYFDFSGYSDMAMGLAALFGIRLPANFASPYRSTSIIDFWRRWHITLSRFLRDYLYVPLGGSRAGRPRQLLNLLVTMLLGGLWHGAGWTFVFWGGLHGFYLVVNHLWRQLPKPGWCGRVPPRFQSVAAWSVTFLAVLVGWVFFRAESFSGATRILTAMAGLSGGGFELFHVPGEHVAMIFLASLIAWFAPNSLEIVSWDAGLPTAGEPRPISARWRFQPNLGWACWLALLVVCCVMQLSSVSEFLYFQF